MLSLHNKELLYSNQFDMFQVTVLPVTLLIINFDIEPQ